MGQSLTSATTAARSLDGVHGFEVPSWRSLAVGARPPLRDLKTMSRVVPDKGGNMRFLRESSKISEHLISSRDSQTPRSMLRSQSGPGAGAFLSTTPSNPLTRIDSFAFRTLLCRRLRLAIPLSRTCRCGHTIDPHGHHRAACVRSGALAPSGIRSGECGRPCLSGRLRPCWKSLWMASRCSGVLNWQSMQPW